MTDAGAAGSGYHCLDAALRLHLHCPPERFQHNFVSGQVPQFLIRLVRAVHDEMPGQLGDAVFYLSDPSFYARFGPPRLDARRANVMLFFGDETGGHYDFSGFRLVLRQYMYSSAPRQFAMPLVGLRSPKADGPVLDSATRPVSAFFSGNMNANRVGLYMALHGLPWPERSFLLNRMAARLLRGRMPQRLDGRLPQSYLAFTEGFGMGLPADAYLEKLEQSRITICPGGFVAPETIRHYEAACAGSVVVSTPLPTAGNHLLESAPFHYVQSWSGLARTLQALLADPARLQDMQARGYAWWKENCSLEGYARFVAGKLREALAP